MAQFVKLTFAVAVRHPVWVNLDLVRKMDRVPRSPQCGSMPERPERTTIYFEQASALLREWDFVEVVEPPDEILRLAAGGRV